ncbi:hypothetical protein [Deinococcus yavapaiensis]|uniref:Uncharacterized protein n=1 Tax=Deinococcus yavapaiensis KR-236 TaxID=694435 RepID=A0A318S1D7_9DEIO|nr:hypothetical protein [Deinococcus yavapaiensis]PYE51046.1 hypothetical protein DES52_116113 [Deinococcus yavapaiensis KR-236]
MTTPHRKPPPYPNRARARALIPLQVRGHAVHSIAFALKVGLLTPDEWAAILDEEKETWERETGLASLNAYTIEERRSNAIAQRAREKAAHA